MERGGGRPKKKWKEDARDKVKLKCRTRIAHQK